MIPLSKLHDVRTFASRVVSWENWVAIATILIGLLASFGLLDNFTSREGIVLGVLTLLATQLLVDRVGILSDIRSDLLGKRKFVVELKPRTDSSFERFSDFAKDAKEVFVVGIDLGFLANADAYFIKSALAAGADVKLMVCDPTSGPALGSVLDAHDERNHSGLPPVHDHLKTASSTVATLKALSDETNAGRLEIRARVDIPAPSLTMVDPRSRSGRIRIELKPYKNNHGEVPFFVIDRSNIWFDVFFEKYYMRLWEDSPVLYVKSGPIEVDGAKSSLDEADVQGP